MKDSNREAFENWAKNNGYHVAKNPVSGIYLSLVCNDAWKAWQAAKASAVPKEQTTDDKCVHFVGKNKTTGDVVCVMCGHTTEAAQEQGHDC